jgi:MFS family permease
MAESNPYLKRFYATRQRLKTGLVVVGLVCGAVVGIAMTILGKIVAGAPPATLSNYLINIAWLAAFGAVIGPVVTWTALRRVPLWRTVVEPLLAGIAGGAIGVALGSGWLFLALVPIGVGAAATRLGYAYREKTSRRLIDGV